jgi:DNA-binding GntR family transcriptional regulator
MIGMKQKSSALSAEVFAVLKDRIINWQYSPAHRFTEEELSEEFGVSRSPIREALQMLVENGLVTKEPYRGYSVRQPDLKEIHDLYDVRQALEMFTVEWLVTHGMPQEQWEQLHHSWQSIAQNLPGYEASFAESDEAFHEKLAACTGNQALVHYLQNIDERLHFVRLTDITTLERLRTTCEQHLQILDCIQGGDVRCAREAMRQNIEGGRQNVEQAVKEALARSFQNLQH